MLSLLYSTLILAALFAPSGADAKSLVQHKLQCMEESDCHRDASTKTVSCDFTIRNETRAYNGWPRTHLLVNGKYPGPCIEAFHHDNVIIRVKNDPGSATAQARNASIHWHGMHLTEPADGHAFAQLYDGTPLTQCPIPPGGEMTYSFKADRIGSHFWHSHYKLSLLDGISGPFIVHDPVDPYLSQYDEERVVLISDFLNETAESHFHNWKEFESAFYFHRPANYNPIWDSYKGGWYWQTNNGTNFWSNQFGTWYQWTYSTVGELVGVVPFVGGVFNGKTLNAVSKTPEVMQVQHDKTYRFRLISSSGFYPFEFSIDNHTFDVISADGDYLQRSGPFNYIQLQTGERYDILLHADKHTGRFWMRAHTLEASFPDHQILGVLSYNDDNPAALPVGNAYLGNSTGTRRANCFHDYNQDCVSAAGLKPLVPTPIAEPDINTSLFLRFLRGPLLNATRFAEPDTPPLFAGGDFSRLPGVFPCNASMTLDQRTAQLGENCTSVLHLDYNTKVRVVLDNQWYAAHIAGLHSIHLHGHSFAVLRMGYGAYTGQALNVVDPPFRDTVIVPPGGHTVIQFTADNPGAWMLHCHQDLHLNDGMATIISTAPEMLQGLRPPADFPMCKSWDTVTYEGNPFSEPQIAAEPEHWPY